DHFLGVLVGPVVVGAAGCDGFEAVRAVPGSHEEVAGCLARRVVGVRLEGVGFGPRAALDCAVHLVGGDVQESPEPVPHGRVEQYPRAGDVRLDEGGCVAHGAVDVGFG